jgi:hypothetical protein
MHGLTIFLVAITLVLSGCGDDGTGDRRPNRRREGRSALRAFNRMPGVPEAAKIKSTEDMGRRRFAAVLRYVGCFVKGS